MPINQSEIPCSSQRNFLSRLWPAAAWVHGKPDPAQISLSGFIDEGINLYSINISKEWRGVPVVLVSTLQYVLFCTLYCKLIDERILQNCVVVRAAAPGPGTGKGFHLAAELEWELAASPGPALPTHFASCRALPATASPGRARDTRGRTRLIHERDKLNQFYFKFVSTKLLSPALKQKLS